MARKVIGAPTRIVKDAQNLMRWACGTSRDPFDQMGILLTAQCLILQDIQRSVRVKEMKMEKQKERMRAQIERLKKRKGKIWTQ